MEHSVRAVYWEAPKRRHIEKSNDWYWIVGIVALAAAIASIVLGNVLFGIVIILGTTTLVTHSHRKPAPIPFEVSVRDLKVGDEVFPYSTLESFFLDEHAVDGPQLLVKSKKLFMPLIIIPVPMEYLHEIETILKSRLTEEYLEEPIAHRIVELLGF